MRKSSENLKKTGVVIVFPKNCNFVVCFATLSYYHIEPDTLILASSCNVRNPPDFLHAINKMA